MKIAYFDGTFRKEDGVTQVILNLVREAEKQKIQCLIITGWSEDSSITTAPVIEVPSAIFPLYKDYRFPWPGMRGFKKQLDEFKPDLIHIHSPDALAWAALKYAKKNKVPILATYHTEFGKYLTYYHLNFLKPLVWIILKTLYNQMGLVTTPSSVTTEDLVKHGIKNVRTIPWGVDFKRFNSTFRSEEWRKKILNGESKKILLCACRLTWEKDLRTLAATFNLLKARRKDFTMIIAGDGPARKELEALMPGAIFLGHLDGAELSRAYASSDILLFPSSTETFGNVTIEAMASGLAPIVADEGGSKFLVEGGKTGFLAKPRDAEDFCKKTEDLLNQPELLKKLRAAALDFSKGFGWEKVFEKILENYKKLSQQKQQQA